MFIRTCLLYLIVLSAGYIAAVKRQFFKTDLVRCAHEVILPEYSLRDAQVPTCVQTDTD